MVSDTDSHYRPRHRAGRHEKPGQIHLTTRGRAVAAGVGVLLATAAASSPAWAPRVVGDAKGAVDRTITGVKQSNDGYITGDAIGQLNGTAKGTAYNALGLLATGGHAQTDPERGFVLTQVIPEQQAAGVTEVEVSSNGNDKLTVRIVHGTARNPLNGPETDLTFAGLIAPAQGFTGSDAAAFIDGAQLSQAGSQHDDGRVQVLKTGILVGDRNTPADRLYDAVDEELIPHAADPAAAAALIVSGR